MESERSAGKESEFFSRCRRYWRFLGRGVDSRIIGSMFLKDPSGCWVGWGAGSI